MAKLVLLAAATLSLLFVASAETRGFVWSTEYNYTKQQLVVGSDTVTLHWNGQDDVYRFLNATAYASCDFSNAEPVTVTTSDDANFTSMATLGPFEKEGKYYYGSSIGCSGLGAGGGMQKITLQAMRKIFKIAGATECEGLVMTDPVDPDSVDPVTSLMADAVIDLESEGLVAANLVKFQACKRACNKLGSCQGFQYKRGVNGKGRGRNKDKAKGKPEGVGNGKPEGVGNGKTKEKTNGKPEGVGNGKPEGAENGKTKEKTNGKPEGVGNGKPEGVGNGKPTTAGNGNIRHRNLHSAHAAAKPQDNMSSSYAPEERFLKNVFVEDPECILLSVSPAPAKGKKNGKFRCGRIKSRLFQGRGRKGYVYDVGVAAESM